MPNKASDVERVTQLRDAVATGALKKATTYSLDQVARALGWDKKMAKRLLAVFAAVQQLPFTCEWEASPTPKSNRYFCRFKDTRGEVKVG